ncbi:MAG: hypothetical protein WD534_05270 [Phycisphaeraceae bacterium]
MPRLFHPLLKMIAHTAHRELAAQVQYLKVENAILRSKLALRNLRASTSIDVRNTAPHLCEPKFVSKHTATGRPSD